MPSPEAEQKQIRQGAKSLAILRFFW